MSEFHIVSQFAPPPPAVPTAFHTDDGTAIPALNVLNVNGLDSIENNDNGLLTRANPNLSDNLQIILTNRATGTVTTVDGTPTISLTFALGAIPGVYYFQGDITAFDTTDIAGGAYSFVSAARTTGVAGVEIGTEFKDVLEEAAMAASDIAVSVSGNNFIVTVTGIAAKTINWNSFLTYRFVS